MPGAELGRHHADALVAKTTPIGGLVSLAVLLLSTILMLLCPSLLADAATGRHGLKATSRPARLRPAPHRPNAPVLMFRLQFDVPKGQPQISPGQRPGNTFSSHARALTGRNRIRFFAGDCDVAIAETCGALTGHALPRNRGSQGVALGWLVVSPSGRNSEPRNTKTRQPGECHFPPGRVQPHTDPTRPF